MSRFRKAAIILLILPLAAGGFALQRRSDREGARLFDHVFGLVATRFVDTLGTDELYSRAARGLLSQLDDPYAALVSPKEMEEFTVETAGRYGGIGLLIEDHEGKFTVNRVFPNTPGNKPVFNPVISSSRSTASRPGDGSSGMLPALSRASLVPR